MENSRSKKYRAKAYFIQASNFFDVSCDVKSIQRYVGCFKHALLFTKKLIVADNMIVNSPNFRMAYRIDNSFRDLICREFIEVAHFDKYKGGKHFTLQDLRQFYKHFETEHHLFNPKLSKEFRNYQYDADLIEIEKSTKQLFPDATIRDPIFSSLILREVDNGSIKPIFGDRYSVFSDAFEILKSRIDNVAPFGHIMFDWNDNPDDDTNIYNIIAQLPYYRSKKIEVSKIYKLYGSDLSRLSRSLFFNAESCLLKGHPFIPHELKQFNNRFFGSTFEKYKEEIKTETLDIDLRSLDYGSVANLTKADILAIRKNGSAYFNAIESFSKESDTKELKKALEQYAQYIRLYVIEKSSGLPVIRPKKGRSKIIQYLIKDQNLREIGIGVTCRLITSTPTSLMNYISIAAAPVMKLSFKVLEAYMEKRDDQQNAEKENKSKEIVSSIILDGDRSFVKQYD